MKHTFLRVLGAFKWKVATNRMTKNCPASPEVLFSKSYGRNTKKTHFTAVPHSHWFTLFFTKITYLASISVILAPHLPITDLKSRVESVFGTFKALAQVFDPQIDIIFAENRYCQLSDFHPSLNFRVKINFYADFSAFL